MTIKRQGTIDRVADPRSRRMLAALLAFALIAGGSHAQENPSAGLTEVLVTGEQPGPGLWKVSSGEHTLWILGTHTPLPKDIKWHSKQVENLLAESQELLLPVKFEFNSNIGFFRAVTLLPALFAAARNPDDALLKDVVTEDAYARWVTLKEKYIGRDKGIEKWRPTFAVMELRSKATQKVGLDNEDVVLPAVTKIAKKHKLKITTREVEMKFKFDEPRATLKKFRKVKLQDAECFGKSVAALEDDLQAMRARANAWSIGDVEELRHLTLPSYIDDCMQVFQSAIMSGQLVEEMGAQETVQNVKRELERVFKEAQQLWMAAAQSALERNGTTFAVLPIREMLQPEGYIAKLRAAGFTVEEPL